MNNLFSAVCTILIFTLLMFAAGCENGEELDNNDVVEHRKSPIVISAITHGETYMKVVYGQPYKRGRDIFGGLEPFGEVWRTGANEATEITITRDIMMNGHLVEEGTYALFTIPEPDEWTIILNTQLGQWGAFNYDEDYDYLRFTRPVTETDEVVEALTITFDGEPQNGTSLFIAWDDTRVEIPIEFL
jgi:hypothetical protein